ncbi:MAG: hypothetical protein IJZ35_05130 [Clostridia bacterium]|nr:hypothetical protein [Clostridia bacterium]
MSKTKKLLSIILAILMIASTVPVAFAADEVAITHQPTSAEPYVEINSSENVTYQWYEVKYNFVNVTDSIAIKSTYGETASSYDETTNNWIGSYNDYVNNTFTVEYFDIDLEAGDIMQINVQIDPDSSDEWLMVEYIHPEEGYDVFVDETYYSLTDTYKVVAPVGDRYTISATCADAEAPLSAVYCKADDYETIKLENETTNNLSSPKIGSYYLCEVSVGDTVVKTDIFENGFAITHQPTAAEPYVELSDDTDAKYEWYYVNEITEITDENAQTFDWNVYGEASSYDSENGWSGNMWGDDGADYFTIHLSAGSLLKINADGPAEELGIWNYDEYYGYYDYDGNNTAVFEIEKDGDYSVYAYFDEEITLTAQFCYPVSIENETTAKLSSTEVGYYFCKVIYKDGTTEISDFFEISNIHTHSGGTQTCKGYLCECGEYYGDAVDHIDNNGDYNCDYGCGYEFEKLAEDTGACEHCGKEHTSFIDDIICAITRFFNMLKDFITVIDPEI